MPTLLEANKVLSDGLVMEQSRQFVMEAHIIRNKEVAAVVLDDPLLYPVKLNAGKMELALAADAATISGLLMFVEPQGSIPATSDLAKKQMVLVRGPAVIRKAMLPAVDLAAGAAFTIATLVTRLAALNILCHDEPAQQSTQLT